MFAADVRKLVVLKGAGGCLVADFVSLPRLRLFEEANRPVMHVERVAAVLQSRVEFPVRLRDERPPLEFALRYKHERRALNAPDREERGAVPLRGA